MTIKHGDFVRATNSTTGLSKVHVWRVLCAKGGLKLWPFDLSAKLPDTSSWRDRRFSPDNFEKVTRPVMGGRRRSLRAIV